MSLQRMTVDLYNEYSLKVILMQQKCIRFRFSSAFFLHNQDAFPNQFINRQASSQN